ncbi:MAG: PPC domain-containing protein [Anaerolineae bacterium]
MMARVRQLSLIGLLLLLLSAVAAIPLAAQSDNTLQPGVPQSGALDADVPAQAFTWEVLNVPQFMISARGTSGAILGLIVTDEAGTVLGTTTGADAASLPAMVADAGTVITATVFNAGPALTEEAPFSILLAVPQVQPVPTTAPEATVEPTEAPATGTAEPTQVVLNQGMSVTLSWPSTDDFDLEVRDPVGGSLYWETPTVTSGGQMSANANQQCVNPTTNATETASWAAGGVPVGSYEVLLYFQSSCNDGASASFQVDVNVDGTSLEPVTATLQPGQVYVFAFELGADGTAELVTTGGLVNVNDLPAASSEILASAEPIAVGDTVTGLLDNATYYRAYSFEAAANVLYTIAVEATSGSLDTLVQVLDDQGRLVRVNDDREEGNTNSTLDSVLLPSAGTYTIVVTRYGKSHGGTVGEFLMSLTESDSGLPADFTANLTPGSLQILLVWNTPADLQLLVRDPGGDAVFDDVPQIASGGRLGAQGNVQCRTSEGAPYSYIYWPQETQPRAGSYEVEVWYQNPCGTAQPTTFNLYVLYQGEQVFATTEQLLPDERFLTSFTINADGTATASAAGVIRGVQDIPYQAELENAVPIAPGQTITGSITPDNKFDLYSFAGAAGDVINIAMNATQGSLDPLLYVIGPDGALVAQNDDAVAGENTNSLIANLTLPADGTYIIIATHFGGPYGGTTGAYSLTFTQLN